MRMVFYHFFCTLTIFRSYLEGLGAEWYSYDYSFVEHIMPPVFSFLQFLARGVLFEHILWRTHPNIHLLYFMSIFPQ